MTDTNPPTTDHDLIATRKLLDTRRFLIGATNPSKAPILGPALVAIRAVLLGGRWRTHEEVVGAALRASPDIAVSTIQSKLWELVRAGLIERCGEYVVRHGAAQASDSRRYRVVDWPESL